MPENKAAPRPGCSCAVCGWLRRNRRQLADLEDNYQRYQRGELLAQLVREAQRA